MLRFNGSISNTEFNVTKFDPIYAHAMGTDNEAPKMMQLRKRWSCLVASGLIASLAACSTMSPSEANSQPSMQLPQNSVCPDIAGVYGTSAETQYVTMSNGKREETRSRSTASWIPNWHPRGVEKDKSVNTVLAREIEPLLQKDQFKIVALSPTKFEVRQLGADGNSILVKTFDANAGDFECHRGDIHLRMHSSSGYSDGVGLDMRISMKISIDASQRLLYLQRLETTSRSLFLLRNDSVTEKYYWFEQQ